MTTLGANPLHPRDTSSGSADGDADAPTFNGRQERHLAELLREKWECEHPGHSVCVPTQDGQHFQLSEADLTHWVNALCKGKTTSADPPDQMFESIRGGPIWNHATGEYGVKAVRISPSRRRASLRTPGSPSSASFRSSEKTSVASKSSWPKFSFTTNSNKSGSTSATSGVQGPGYLAGKALKMFGTKSIGLVEDNYIMVHGNGHIDRLAKWTKRDLVEPQLGVEEREKVYEMLGEALEMSRQCYPGRVNKLAYSIGRAIQHWLQSYPGIPTTHETSVWLVHIQLCLIPLLLAQISQHDPLAGDLAHTTCSTLTREPLKVQDFDIHAKVIRLIARELAYSKCTYQHSWLGFALLRIVQMSCRLRSLTQGEVQGIRELGERRTKKHDEDFSLSRPWEVPLFAQCVGQEVRLKEDVLGPTGLPSLLRALERMVSKDQPSRSVIWEGVALTLRALAFLSEHDWVAAAVPEGIVGPLIDVFRHDVPERWFCTRFWAMDTLRNLIAHRPEIARTLIKERDSAAALASLSQSDVLLNHASSGASPRRSDTVPSTTQTRLFEAYKREATNRANELEVYLKRWTDWTPDALPKLEVVPVSVMIADWEV